MKTPGLAEDDVEQLSLPDVLPVLALRDTVVFPYVIVPISVSPDRGVEAVDQALGDQRLIMLTAQQDLTVEEPTLDDLHRVGTVGLIMRMLKLPDERIRILVQGLVRAELESLSQLEPFLKGRIRPLTMHPVQQSLQPAALEDRALVGSVRESLERAHHLGKNFSPEVLMVAASLDDPGRLADLVASNLELETPESQEILETLEPTERLRRIAELMARELDLLTMQHEISSQAQGEIDRSQREYFLRQQLKAIQRELGETDELAEEIEEYRARAEARGLPDEATTELEKQIQRLERSHPESGEHTVLRTYLDWLTGLPWSIESKDRLELRNARTVLDADHYGLEKVKERIVEFLAVRSLKRDSKGPILCFVGPPGVGKTSLGRSIARALGRRFVRLSLGGVRDEAEIRGHRRTYVGALPGRILQGLHQAGTGNPVFMLDEIDKIGADSRGDPSSALLEVLDPEQNSTFRDHYLGVPYDLSRVLFIATANLLDPIQPAFLDRMEVIRLSGYTEEEKLEIARRHLVPKQRDENGLDESMVQFTGPGLQRLIRGYTREAGLRNLEREIGSICRKVAVRVAEGRRTRARIDARRVETLLGPERHFNESLLAEHRIGVATGLAWTAAGGDLLLIEAIAVPGRGRLHLTGRLGDVMRESAQAALTYARRYAAAHGLEPDPLRTHKAPSSDHGEPTDAGATDSSDVGARDFFARHDFHIHAPAGSIPKDGPSAGITIATAIVSVLTGRPVDREIAMTGEITLRGDVLPIGGLKEKALAARAAGIRTVVVPRLNERDLGELPRTLRKAIDFRCLGHVGEVLDLALRPRAAVER
ncbi:MAG: endopeptidase La [Acidobacteriota bacterium]